MSIRLKFPLRTWGACLNIFLDVCFLICSSYFRIEQEEEWNLRYIGASFVFLIILKKIVGRFKIHIVGIHKMKQK